MLYVDLHIFEFLEKLILRGGEVEIQKKKKMQSYKSKIKTS